MPFLYAREPYRGRRLGRDLLRELARIAKRKQLCKIEWVVRGENTEARRFYQKVRPGLIRVKRQLMSALDCS